MLPVLRLSPNIRAVRRVNIKLYIYTIYNIYISLYTKINFNVTD